MSTKVGNNNRMGTTVQVTGCKKYHNDMGNIDCYNL